MCTIAPHVARRLPVPAEADGGCGSRAVADSAHGCAPASERDPHASRLSEAGSQGRRAQIHGLLLNPPEYLQTAKVFDLLLAVPKYGRVKVNRILTQCRISPSKTIGGLSERQRGELVSYLRR